jgi:ATP-dependent Clp protease, protease subunit
MKNKLIQMLQANANRPKPPSNASTATDIYLYDVIGDWYGITASDFVDAVRGADSGAFTLHINCPGGDVFDGRAIATTIKSHPAKVTAVIEGVCASAATYIALAADEVKMADGAQFMIHNAWTLALGNADDMESTASLLRKVDSSILDDYVAKTGKEREEIAAAMAAETWYDAKEAKEFGFVDEIIHVKVAKNTWDLSAYDNAPKVLETPNDLVDNREKFERRLRLIESLS